MSYSKIGIHAVWETKDRLPLLTKEIRKSVCKQIIENAQKHSIHIDTIDGYTDHMHCFFYMNPTISLAETLQLLKGESSKWINEELDKNTIQWEEDYFAFSISESMTEVVRQYIRNQKEYHKKISFKEECGSFLNKHTKNYKK